MKARLILSATVLLAALPALAQTPAPPETDPARRIVASINGEVVTARELDQMYARLSPQLRENYEKAGGRMQFLDNYLRKRLVIQEALKQGFHKRPDVALELQAVRESILFDRYIRDVIADQVVSEADLQAFYKGHSQEFSTPEMVRVRHIIATADDKPVVNSTGDNAKSSDEALEKIKKLAMMFKTTGGNFVELARQLSEDGTAPAGGDLGWFARGKMVPEFEEAAFRMKRRGETSPVVKTEFGYHVLMLEERRDAGVRRFSEVREEIRQRLVHERQAQVMEEVGRLTQELRAASRITVYPENL